MPASSGITISFPFDSVSGATPGLRRYGVADLTTDSENGYRITCIRLHAQRRGGPDRMLLPGDEKFAEVSKVLIAERADEMVARLNDALMRHGVLTSRGHHMPRFVPPASLAA